MHVIEQPKSALTHTHDPYHSHLEVLHSRHSRPTYIRSPVEAFLATVMSMSSRVSSNSVDAIVDRTLSWVR